VLIVVLVLEQAIIAIHVVIVVEAQVDGLVLIAILRVTNMPLGPVRLFLGVESTLIGKTILRTVGVVPPVPAVVVLLLLVVETIH